MTEERRRGRPRGFTPEKALDAALLTFWRQGYRATSLDDLVAATGASRASLYQLFGDKRALFLRCLDLYGERFAQRVEEAAEAEPTMRAALARILGASADRLTSSEAPAGCLRCNSTLELMGSDEAIDAALATANARFLEAIAGLVGKGVEAGELDEEAAGPLPLLITAAVNGMVTLARGGVGRAALESVIQGTLRAWDAAAPG